MVLCLTLLSRAFKNNIWIRNSIIVHWLQVSSLDYTYSEYTVLHDSVFVHNFSSHCFLKLLVVLSSNLVQLNCFHFATFYCFLKEIFHINITLAKLHSKSMNPSLLWNSSVSVFIQIINDCIYHLIIKLMLALLKSQIQGLLLMLFCPNTLLFHFTPDTHYGWNQFQKIPPAISLS